MNTPFKISNGTPFVGLYRDVRTTLPINELKGYPPKEDSTISNINMRRGAMIFSKIDRYPFVTTPNMETKVKKTVNRYNMIEQIQNIKPCGKCSGAK